MEKGQRKRALIPNPEWLHVQQCAPQIIAQVWDTRRDNPGGLEVWGFRLTPPPQSALSCICDQQSLSQLAAADISCDHIWVGTRRVNNVHGEDGVVGLGVGGAAASLSICHGSNNNVLSLKACFDTCCRDRISATCIQQTGPVGPACSSELARITAEHLQRKSGTKIPPIWPSPLIQPPFFHSHSPWVHIISTSLSQLGHFTLQNQNKNIICVHFLCGFAFSPAPLWLRQAETCVSALRKYCAYTGGQCWGLNETQLWEIWVRATVFTGMHRLSVISSAGWAEADWRWRTPDRWATVCQYMTDWGRKSDFISVSPRGVKWAFHSLWSCQGDSLCVVTGCLNLKSHSHVQSLFLPLT